jgi:DNA processing protein
MNNMTDDELIYRLALHFIPGIGPVRARSLISYCGGVKEIFRSRRNQLERIPGIGRERANLIHTKGLFEKAEKEIEFMEKNNVSPLFFTDMEYPSRLKNCYDAPLLLFYKGHADLNVNRMIGIVGTRFITDYGKMVTEKILSDLAAYNIHVISGLAHGIDVHAHKGSLRNNIPTIGVIAHGLDRIYPAENRNTATKMIADGGLISEYPSGTIAARENFPARNRIVAGMCDALIVVESAERGGALITAEFANEYNREVFAVPGRISDIFSQGCHRLISQNKAVIYESAKQFANQMGWDDDPKSPQQPNQLQLFPLLSEPEQKLVEILREKGKSEIDMIAEHSNMPVNKVSSLLLTLEFAGILRSLPGKVYQLK